MFKVRLFNFRRNVQRTNVGGSEYNLELEVTTFTPDSPPQTQYRQLGSTYLITGPPTSLTQG